MKRPFMKLKAMSRTINYLHKYHRMRNPLYDIFDGALRRN
jgi:hypothetical protein